MRRLTTLAVALLMLGMTFMLHNSSNVEAQDYGGDEIQPISLFWYGVVDTDNDGQLNTTSPTATQDTKSACPQAANTNLDGPAEIGTWETEPLQTNVTIAGDIFFELWAQATEGDGVDDVYFILNIFGLEIETEKRSVADQPVHFSGNATLPNPVTRSQNSRISFSLDYDGDDDYNPLQDDQINLLTSSVDHPSRIVLNIDHVRTTFRQPVVDRENEKFLFNTTITSAFGNEDLLYDSWSLSVRGKSSGFIGTSFDPPRVIDDSGQGIQVLFAWNYNIDRSPSDSYYVMVTVTDIQENEWTQQRDSAVELVYGNKIVNLKVSPDGIEVDGQSFIKRIVVDKPVIVSVEIEAGGDPTVTRNPVEWAIYASREGLPSEEQLSAGTIPHLPPETSQEVSVKWTPTETGQYKLRVALDEANYISETREDDNGAEMVVEVIDEERSRISAFFDDLRDDPLVAGLFALALIATALLIVMAVVVARRGGGRYSSSAEDDDWGDDDF